MRLRDYQQDIYDQLVASCSNDLVQLDTGAGKTPIEAALAAWAPRSMLVAHRITLIRQASEKLAAFRLEHDTVSTEHTRRRCMAAHRPHGRHYIRRGHATRLVVSIDSLHAQLKRGALSHIDLDAEWLIIIDEAHHVVPDNKWGALRTIMPNARIIGFTATPGRMDGESLHVSKGGLFDRLVQARELGDDSARVLIERGYLSDFVAYLPPSREPDIDDYERLVREVVDDMENATQAALAGREYMPRDTVRKSAPKGLDYDTGIVTLEGDPVREYLRRAKGTQAILMAPAIKNAEQFALDFRDAGVPAGVIHSTLPQSQVTRALDAFESGRIRVLCNVDMIGEGFDMPAVQTLIIASRTASFPRYRQWVGRVLRPAPGKERAIIIDLTRMIEAHGMPDEPVKWDLLNPPKCPANVVGIPCDECGVFYKMRLRECPECGAENIWLRTGAPLGNYEFEVKILEGELVQGWRRQINEEIRARELAERRRAGVIWPNYSDLPGLIGKTVGALRTWFVEQLQAGKVPCEQINDFLESPAAREREFWMTHFTAADIKRSGQNKAKKVLRAWQKSLNTA